MEEVKAIMTWTAGFNQLKDAKRPVMSFLIRGRVWTVQALSEESITIKMRQNTTQIKQHAMSVDRVWVGRNGHLFKAGCARIQRLWNPHKLAEWMTQRLWALDDPFGKQVGWGGRTVIKKMPISKEEPCQQPSA